VSRAEHKHIDGDTLATALLSGIHCVIGQQELLNRINVFPVADSDTGTNLSLSLSAALGILEGDPGKHLGTMLAATADALLDGARSNSGAIIAQFFQAMSDAAGEVDRFSSVTFSRAVSLGSEYAHDALSRPREGTILSVIAAFSGSLSDEVLNNAADDLSAVIALARKQVDAALANTPQQLDVLRKAGVVDAGAKGFAELVGGLSDYLSDGRITPMPEMAILNRIQPTLEVLAADNTSRFRYCTECLVSAVEVDRRKLREAITEVGDSMVLAGTKRKVRIHIHVDDPEAVFGIARQFGGVSGEKVDDMRRQQSAAHGASMRFAVITDSGADICDDDMERLNIHMVSCRIQFGDRGYLDKLSITNDEFYAELTTNPQHPTTSQPTPGDFRRQFHFLASHFSDVLAVTLTSGASGSYEGAQSAAKRCKAPGRIRVLDSLNASVGQGHLAVLAAECAAAGLGIDATRRIVEEQVPRTRTFALLDDLRYAVRGGRLPRWVKAVADLFRITPIIHVNSDGRIGLCGFLPGRRNRVARFARFVISHCKATDPVDVGIGHAVCPADASLLAAELQKSMPTLEALKIFPLGTGIGVHGGPGTLLVSTWPALSVHDLAIGID